MKDLYLKIGSRGDIFFAMQKINEEEFIDKIFLSIKKCKEYIEEFNYELKYGELILD